MFTQMQARIATNGSERGTPTAMPRSNEEWDGQFWNADRLAAAARAQNPGGDGRTVANDASWMGALNNLSGITVRDQARAGYTQYGESSDNEVAATDAVYQDKFGRMYQTVKGADGDPNTYIQFIDKNGAGFQNAEGSGRDRVAPIYKLNPDGTATPHSANTSYREGQWSRDGQEIATWAAIMATAGIGGAAIEAGAAGAGAGGGGGAVASGGGGVAGASAGSGSAIGADLGAYIGAAEGGAGAGTAGGAAGGGAAATGATNAALAESAVGTAGYGASSAGAGGGAGTLASTGYMSSAATPYANAASGSLWDAAGNYLASPQGQNTAASLVGGYLQSNAAKKAADAQVNSTREANATLRGMYDQTRADNMPALEARNAGLTGYQNLLKDPSSVANDPGVKFGMQQGTTAIDRSAASKGSLYSGATLKALNRFGNDYGTTKYDAALGRYGTLAGIGQPGSSTIANSGSNTANGVSNNQTGAGNALASGYVGQANAWTNALGNTWNGWQQYNALKGG